MDLANEALRNGLKAKVDDLIANTDNSDLRLLVKNG